MVKRMKLKKIKKKKKFPSKKCSKYHKSKTMTDEYLNENLEKFYKSLEPTINNQLKKYETFLKIKKILFDEFKEIKEIYLYGSFFQNIDTENSVIDMTVICNKNFLESYEKPEYETLINICNILNKDYFKSKYIDANVPIVQGKCLTTSISFDISFGHKERYSVGLLIKNKILEIPILRPVILIVKHILSINNLNKPYTGGMNSFVLFHLVYAYYKLIKDQIDDEGISLKLFLMRFLNFYGNYFDQNTYSILNDKTEACLIKKKLFNSFSEDKMDIQCFKKFPNAAEKCFNYKEIKRMFHDVYDKLCELEEKNEKNIDLTDMFYGTYYSQSSYSSDSFYSDMCYRYGYYDYNFSNW